MVIRWIIEHENLQECLPHYLACGKDTKKNLQALESMKEAYATLTSVKQGQNGTFRNVVLSAMVSNGQERSQSQLAKVIGAFRYMIKKTVQWHVHSDTT
jgi:hypothetical protein